METAKLQCRACLSVETASRKHRLLSENGLNEIFQLLTQIQVRSFQFVGCSRRKYVFFVKIDHR